MIMKLDFETPSILAVHDVLQAAVITAQSVSDAGFSALRRMRVLEKTSADTGLIAHLPP